MIRDEAYHLHALRTNGKILEGLRQLWEPRACKVNPERVLKTLNNARVSFVVIGAYGVTGYRDEPQATGDMDILVRRSHHWQAEVAIADAFPKLAARNERFATRWEDPGSGKVVIDLWKPIHPLLKKMWKYVVSINALPNTLFGDGTGLQTDDDAFPFPGSRLQVSRCGGFHEYRGNEPIRY